MSIKRHCPLHTCLPHVLWRSSSIALFALLTSSSLGQNTPPKFEFSEGTHTQSWNQLGQDIDGNSMALSADGQTVLAGASRVTENGRTFTRPRIFNFNQGTSRWIRFGSEIGEPVWGYPAALSSDGTVASLSRAGSYNIGDTYFSEAGVFRLNLNPRTNEKEKRATRLKSG